MHFKYLSKNAPYNIKAVFCGHVSLTTKYSIVIKTILFADQNCQRSAFYIEPEKCRNIWGDACFYCYHHIYYYDHYFFLLTMPWKMWLQLLNGYNTSLGYKRYSPFWDLACFKSFVMQMLIAVLALMDWILAGAPNVGPHPPSLCLILSTFWWKFNEIGLQSLIALCPTYTWAFVQ